MTEEVEYLQRPEVTDPIIEIVNQGLYEYKSQLVDFFKQVTSEIDPKSDTLELVFISILHISYFFFNFFYYFSKIYLNIFK